MPNTSRSLPGRRIRVLATAVVVAIGAAFLPAASRAADPPSGPNQAIQSIPDVQRVKVEASASVTTRFDPFVPPQPDTTNPATKHYRIAYEIAGGPGDDEPSGFSPLTPDGGCTITVHPTGAIPPPPNFLQPQCTVTLANKTGKPGTSLVYFWLDRNALIGDDGKVINPQDAARVAEVDGNEGRLADQARDCPGLDPSTHNGTCQTGTPKPGTVGEPDGTDVVEVTWYPAPAHLECIPVDGASAPDTVTIKPAATARFDCVVTAVSGESIPNVVIDGENYSDGSPPEAGPWTNDGANDPDGGTPPDEHTTEANRPESPDYDNACITGSSGHCIIDIPATQGHLGSAVVCFWMDGIMGARADAPTDETPDSVFARPSKLSAKEESDGGKCDSEWVDETANGPSDLGDAMKRTELVQVNWEPPLFINGGIDLQPETQTHELKETAKVTAVAYDQFGDPISDIVVWFEFFRGSVTTASTEASPDLSCVTDAKGSCSVTFTSIKSGLDAICAWTQMRDGEPGPDDNPAGRGMTRPKDGEGSPVMIGTSKNPQCGAQPRKGKAADLEGPVDTTADDGKPAPKSDAFDVIQVIWKAPPTPTTAPPPPPPPPPPKPTPVGYWMVAADGGVFAFGDVGFYGSTGNVLLNKPIVTSAATPSGKGYWLVASDGGVFAFGDAGFYGSTGSMVLNKPIVGMRPTPTGKGYWLVASDGGIFAFGDAPFLGSTGSMKLNQPIIDMTATRDGKGYWLLASDGGLFTFGEASYFGSTGDFPLASPVVTMAPTPTADGYWLVTADGNMFTFGEASYYGGPSEGPLNMPIVDMAATPSGDGYWLVASDGGMFAFGDAPFFGSAGAMPLNRPILALAPAIKLV